VTTPPGDATTRLRALASARARIATILTLLMIVIYFGFISLIAFAKETMGRTIVPGLSVGILLGALVIVASWLLTWFYVRWSNVNYDGALRDIGAEGRR
jgi:uncharacterized membrane protein (DUF485 family)